MSDYQRNRVAGGTYFFTVTLYDRSSDLLVTHIDALREAVRVTATKSLFHIDAWVVLPEHMHCIWTLPEGDTDHSGRWRAIKIAFSKSFPGIEHRPAVMEKRANGEIGLVDYAFAHPPYA